VNLVAVAVSAERPLFPCLVRFPRAFVVTLVVQSALHAALLPADSSGFDDQLTAFAFSRHDRLLALSAAFALAALVTPLATLVFLPTGVPALDDQPFVLLCHIASLFDFCCKKKRLTAFPLEASLFPRKRVMANLYNRRFTTNSESVSRDIFF
jgi:hypothetical protein